MYCILKNSPLALESSLPSGMVALCGSGLCLCPVLCALYPVITWQVGRLDKGVRVPECGKKMRESLISWMNCCTNQNL